MKSGLEVSNDKCRSSQSVDASTNSDDKLICWHRELPPNGTEAIGEHILETNSARISGHLHSNELWDQGYANLMARTRHRLAQEVRRLGGDCAHVLSEAIIPERDERTGESWLHGRFDYVLYREPDISSGINPH
jgi:hypothetical protein